jgi:peptide/nickel transport system substrate-binding protein
MLVVASSLLALTQQSAYKAPHSKPGPAADKLIYRSFSQDRASLDLKAGQMDLYLFGLKTEAAQEIRSTQGFRLLDAPATTLSLVLNPSPAPQGRLNPFNLKEVRQAMQYLVNREFIARDIYRGNAVPMVTHVSPYDYDFLTVYDIDRGSGIRYDPEYARNQIAAAMKKAGAEQVSGKWAFKGQPIRLRFIARVEDERRQIGDLVRAELDKAGFEVTMVYQTFAPAVLTVYSTDPKAFEWHLYTEGWGRGSTQRYDYGGANSFNAPWLGNMPGWQQVGFWQYQNDELDKLGQQLFKGEFKSLEERNKLYRRVTELGLDESVRMWLVTATNSFPVTDKLTGITEDLSAGLRSPWTLREAYVPGKDSITVGNLWVWTERTTWNPVGGFGDLYSSDILRNLTDPAVFNHPFTGVPQAGRASYKVETAGPSGKLDVPNDAVIWDAKENRWEPVAGSAKATSKVTLDFSKYTRAKWHHGQPIDMADALYSIAQGYELAYDPDKSKIEVAISVTSRPVLETFKGYKVLDENRLEVYVDFWNFDPNYIGAYAVPAGFGFPWELLAAGDDLVFKQRKAAYSDTAAGRFSVPWLSFVVERDVRLMERTLRQMASEGVVPEGVFKIGNKSFITPDAAKARYQAALDWAKQHKHLVISSGPFYLTRYDPPAQYAELQAFRDPGYPYKPGDRYYGTAPQLAISKVDAPKVGKGKAANVSITVRGATDPDLKYLLLEPSSGKVVKTGDVKGNKGEFTLSLDAATTSKLNPGLYRLYLATSSDGIAQVTERRVDLEVTQ